MGRGRSGLVFFDFSEDDAAAAELEFNGLPPLFWWALFGPADLREARVSDDEDSGTAEREDLLVEFGDATYPYLVATRDDAVQRFVSRRDGIVTALGTVVASLYDDFAAYVRDSFGNYLLLRTSGLIDVVDARPHFENELADLAAFDAAGTFRPGGPLAVAADEYLRSRGTAAPWMLTGSGQTGLRRL
jgi:hypothetical protein